MRLELILKNVNTNSATTDAVLLKTKKVRKLLLKKFEKWKKLFL